MFLKFEIVAVLVLPFVTCSGGFLKDCQVVCSVNGRVKFARPISLKHLFLVSELESQKKCWPSKVYFKTPNWNTPQATFTNRL